jgi:chromate transporter
MPFDRLWALVMVFAPLSLVSIGGGPSIFAEMQRQSVAVHGWLTDAQFLELFALSRATPGPGSLIGALIGWQAAGFWGALVAMLSLYLPSSLVLCLVGSWWRRRGDSPARRIVERGLAPVAVGLIFAGAWRLLMVDGAGLLEVATALVTATLRVRGASPYWVMGAVALLYAGLFAGGAIAA